MTHKRQETDISQLMDADMKLIPPIVKSNTSLLKRSRRYGILRKEVVSFGRIQ